MKVKNEDTYNSATRTIEIVVIHASIEEAQKKF